MKEVLAFAAHMTQSRFGSFCRRATLALAGTLFSTVLWSSNASAHGGIPRGFGVIFEPGNEKDIILRSDVWGFFRSNDGGATWQYACSEVFGGIWSQAEDVPTMILPGGQILVANITALYSSTDFCDWNQTSPATFGSNTFLEDLISVGSDLVMLTGSGVDGGIVGKMFRSSDKGQTWTPFANPLPDDFSPQEIAFAPSDSKRIYVTGQTINTNSAVLERSDDGGNTWTSSPIPMTLDPSQIWTIRISGVHPTNEDLVFIRADGLEGLGTTVDDQVWFTKDGGKSGASSFSELYGGQGDLPGFTFSPDGTQLLLAGPNDGIRGATVADVTASGGAALTQIFDGQVWGLTWMPDALYAGTNDFTPGTQPKFTFGKSTDGGKTFTGIMTVCDVQFGTTCGATSSIQTACENTWSQFGGYDTDYINGPRCVTPGPDAGPHGGSGGSTSKPASSSSGCSFSADEGGSPAAASLALSAFVGGLVAFRLKRRAGQRSRGV